MKYCGFRKCDEDRGLYLVRNPLGMLDWGLLMDSVALFDSPEDLAEAITQAPAAVLGIEFLPGWLCVGLQEVAKPNPPNEGNTTAATQEQNDLPK